MDHGWTMNTNVVGRPTESSGQQDTDKYRSLLQNQMGTAHKSHTAFTRQRPVEKLSTDACRDKAGAAGRVGTPPAHCMGENAAIDLLIGERMACGP